jgi:RNA polymerase sigma-70 factor (ECF subfamily)
MNREAELELVARLRAGEPEAFDAAHDAFNARLFNFLARLSNRRELAEDLLEETWLRLVIHAHRLRPDTRLSPWLFTVARHLHTSYCRSRSVEDSYASSLISLWPAGSATPSPLESAEASEAQRRLSDALASLPITYREALLLVGIEGLRPAEAADICGVTPEAMRQRLSRARALLARRIAAGEVPGLAALREIPT